MLPTARGNIGQHWLELCLIHPVGWILFSRLVGGPAASACYDNWPVGYSAGACLLPYMRETASSCVYIYKEERRHATR